MRLLICALLPVALGGILPLLWIKGRREKGVYALIATLLTSALVAVAILQGAGDRTELLRLTDRFVIALRLDWVGSVYIGLAALLWPLAALYAIEYMAHEQREGNFFCWYTMAFGPAILLAAADNLFTLYIAYELLTLCTVPLVWHEQDDASTKAALRYMLYLIGGAALGFMAMLGLSGMGLGEFHGTPALPDKTNLSWFRALCLLGFFGFGVKAAPLPFCKWLPSASVAPTPVTALLHAVAVVNAGVFAVLRFFYDAVPLEAIRGTWVQTVMVIVSLSTVLFGSVMAVREQHLKRRLAWSTVSNLSYMLLGLSLLSREGMTAGLSHMVFHGMMKIILFFCAGAVLVQTGRTQVRQTHGLGRQMPLTFGAFTLAGLSLMGVPPLPGFVSKYALVTAAFQEGSAAAMIGSIALLISAVLTCIYIFTVAFPAFFLRKEPEETEARDPGLCMKITFVLLCLILIIAGLFAGRIMTYLAALSEGVTV